MFATLATVVLLSNPATSVEDGPHEDLPRKRVPLGAQSRGPGVEDDLREDPPPAPAASTLAGRTRGSVAGVALANTMTVVSSATTFFAMWGLTGFHLCLFSCANGENNGFAVALVAGAAIDVLGALVLMPIGATLGHRAAGGEGGYGAAFAGTAVGLVTGGALVGVGSQLLFKTDGGQVAAGGALIVLGVASFVAGPMLGLELAHGMPRFGVAPTKDGGMVTVSVEL